jgi:hypothetical protein
MLGAFVVLLAAVACGGPDDGAVSEPPPTAELEPEPLAEPTQAEKDWLEAYGQAFGPLSAESRASSSEMLACVDRVMSGSLDISECRPFVVSNQALLVAMRDAVNGLPPAPATLEFLSDAWDEFVSEGLAASELVLEGLDAAPESLEQIRLFDQSAVLDRRARASLATASFRFFALVGEEIPDLTAEGMALDSVLWDEETYDPWTAAEFEYLKGLDDPEVSLTEMSALAANAGAALDDYLATLRALPEPEHEPFAEVLQDLIEGYETISKSYAEAAIAWDPLDEQLLTTAGELRSEGFPAAGKAELEFQQLLLAAIAARE